MGEHKQDLLSQVGGENIPWVGWIMIADEIVLSGWNEDHMTRPSIQVEDRAIGEGGIAHVVES